MWSSDFVNHSYDYRSNWTSLSHVTITYSFILITLHLRKNKKGTDGEIRKHIILYTKSLNCKSNFLHCVHCLKVNHYTLNMENQWLDINLNNTATVISNGAVHKMF